MSATGTKDERDLTGSEHIHDAEGVRPHAGDRFEMRAVTDRERHVGRVVEVRHTGDSFRPSTVVVCWDDNARVGEVEPAKFEHCCRIIPVQPPEGIVGRPEGGEHGPCDRCGRHHVLMTITPGPSAKGYRKVCLNCTPFLGGAFE